MASSPPLPSLNAGDGLRSTDLAGMLRALPRLTAPPSLARGLRRELARARRRQDRERPSAFWPTAVAIQMALLGALCAAYVLATPPTAVVVESPSPSSASSDERQRARASSAAEVSESNHGNTGPTNP